MKVNINITLEDDTTEEELRSQGITRQKLMELYQNAFAGFLEAGDNGKIKKELLVVVTDNTWE